MGRIEARRGSARQVIGAVPSPRYGRARNASRSGAATLCSAPLDARAELDRVIEEILRPLLEADGGGLEVLEARDDELVLALTGAFRGDPGAPYVQSRVVRPAIVKALGRDIRIRWTVPSEGRISKIG
jgi:Fe-S cluster biogenesis protein NfuA